jgi:hypothetical protein
MNQAAEEHCRAMEVLVGCVELARLFSLSEPQFLHLQSKDNGIYFIKLFGKHIHEMATSEA